MPMPSSPVLAGCLAAAAILVAAPATAEGDAGPDLQPATQAAIIAGARACLGTTVDPASQDARLTGWVPATADQRKGMDADGDVRFRDHVMLVFKTGKEGGCVVMASPDASFDPATFYSQVSAIVGATVQPASAPAPITLPNGELLVPVISPKTDADPAKIILVFANSAGQYAKKGN